MTPSSFCCRLVALGCGLRCLVTVGDVLRRSGAVGDGRWCFEAVGDGRGCFAAVCYGRRWLEAGAEHRMHESAIEDGRERVMS